MLPQVQICATTITIKIQSCSLTTQKGIVQRDAFTVTPSPSSPPGNYWSVLYYYNFASLNMLYKWNHSVWNFFILAFISQHTVLEIHPSCYVCLIFLPCLFFSSISLSGCTKVCFSTHPLSTWGHMVFFSFWLLETKLLCTGLCANTS